MYGVDGSGHAIWHYYTSDLRYMLERVRIEYTLALYENLRGSSQPLSRHREREHAKSRPQNVILAIVALVYDGA